jgi:uncharacterized protein (TIGR03118 family)
MGPWWVADNGTGLSTLYDGSGNVQSLVVTIPPPMGSPDGTTSTPTGIVFNGGGGFNVSNGTTSGSSVFIFATEDGTIAGWSPSVDLHNAFLPVDVPGTTAVYKGLAIGSNDSGTFIYATNFHDARVDVFDSNFAPAHLSGNFTDPQIPKGYAPFGIQNIGGRIFVTYTLQSDDRHDDVGGRAHGFIDVYDTDGNLVQRFHDHFPLNSPWGMALAPADFGPWSNDLLVGNFGDGAINVFDPNTGQFLGPLNNGPNNPVVVDGLWALQFGNDHSAGAHNTLFFTAGINGEADGLFGNIQFVPGAGNATGPKTPPPGSTLQRTLSSAHSDAQNGDIPSSSNKHLSANVATASQKVAASLVQNSIGVTAKLSAAHTQLFADLGKRLL